jgi:hypothetical protein
LLLLIVENNACEYFYWESQLGKHSEPTMTETIKKMLGYILINKSGITNAQFEAAFSDPRIAGSLRQKIMSQKGVLLTERAIPLAAALKLTSGVRQPIGNMLVKSEVITRGQLERALEVQHQTGERIGEIFSRLGMLETSSLDEALRSQQENHQTIPVQAAFKIGEILVASGHITSEQLNESLELQKQSNKKLGEILVEKGYVAQHHVEHGIRLQQMLVTAALGTVMSISSINAAASPSGGTSTATIQATAFVKPIARAKMLYQQPQLEITSQHIAQGYIEVARASRIELRNNSHSGFILTIENQGEPFSDVYVNGLENQIQLHSGTAWVLMPFTPVSKTFELSYRFILSANAKAGSYPWPLQITATMM